MATDPDPRIAALRVSHDELVQLAGPLDDAALTHESYCADWDVSQVLAHLGNSAEIRIGDMQAALDGREPPARDTYQAIWDRWDALSPSAKRDAFVEWDTKQVELFESLTPDQRANVSFPLFGLTLDAAGVAAMRLSEHALHSWDVRVAFDPSATLLPDATAQLLDGFSLRASFVSAEPVADWAPFQWAIVTSSPDREFVLTVDGAVRAVEDAVPDDADGVLTIPAEALLRLASGRLDPDHTPDGIDVQGDADVVVLRHLFGGY
jgi:uncharacterized protein (TIGR03083 family)